MSWREGNLPTGASMRPRHYTAENVSTSAPHVGLSGGFNEAAALHRGKHLEIPDVAVDRLRASMRPRHYTAENGRFSGTRRS